MPPRTFSAVGYVSQPVTVMMLRFVEGEPVIAGRSTAAGRRRAKPVDLSEVELNQLEPATEGALDASAPHFPVNAPDIPNLSPPALGTARPGRDYMPRIREPYEFRTTAEYEAYLAGMQEALATMQAQPSETVDAPRAASQQTETVAAVAPREMPPEPATPPTRIATPTAELERLNPIFLKPQQPNGLSELSVLTRESLSQYPDLQSVSTHNLVNLLFERSNAGLRNHEPAVATLQQKLPKVQQVNVYLLASENTNASWRGPDDSTGKGGIIVILPTRYYYDPQQFYRYVASALINQPVTSEDVAKLGNYFEGATAQSAANVKQFAIETNYLDHGWDEEGDMRRWADESLDFFKHVQEAVRYLKPRLETMASERRAVLEPEIAAVEDWLAALGASTVTVNFGLYKGKGDAPAPKADAATRTVWISCRAEEYVQSEQRDERWPLYAKVIEGFNGLKGRKFDPGLAGAISDILENYAQDKDNKLMIAFRLKTDFPPKPPDWPRLAGVPRAPTVIVSPAAQTETAKIPGGAVASSTTLSPPPAPAPAVVAEQTKMTEPPQTAPTAPPSAVAKADPQTPQLQERNPQTTQSTTSPRTRWADPEFGEQIVALITSHMKGLDDSSVRARVLQTMVNSLIIVRDPNPNFHSRVSSIDLKNPNPDHFEFTVNKTEYFDALFLLGRKDKMAHEVIWSTFAENAATVECAAGNSDFAPLYKTLQSDLSTVVKRHTNGAEVSPEIFADPQFKALLPYYTTFWSNWQFAGERVRFQYLHDRVSSKRLRQLAEAAGNDSETRAVRGDLLGLADEVDLFYGDANGIPDAVPAVETNRAGMRANSMDSIALAREPARESEPKENRPANMGPAVATATKMKQFTSVLERVEDPSKERLQSQDAYRRAFIIRLMVDAWGRTSPEQQKKLLAGQWSGADLRFVLAILSEIQAKRLNQDLDSNAIVRLSKDMPWIADPKFELTSGAFDRLPATLEGQP